jgi:hypothetical protein
MLRKYAKIISSHNKGGKNVDAEKVYLSMTGELIHPISGIQNAFAPGQPCEKLYHQIYEAKCRICDRLRKDEDSDVERILDDYYEITRELCLRMYRLGLEHGIHPPETP